MSELQVLPSELIEISKNVSEEKRLEVQSVLNSVFNGVSKMRNQLDNVTVTDEKDTVSMELSKTIRLNVRKVRLDAEKTFDAKRNEVQLQMLGFKTEDQLWLKAKQTMQILTKEIEDMALWKEKTKERYELEQKELKTQQRIIEVSKVAPQILRTEFENMTDEVFSIFLDSITKAYNEKLEADKKAEEERLAKIEAERIENERIRIENERLKKEAIEKELIEKENQKKQAEILLFERKKLEAEKQAEAKKQAKILAEQKLESERIAKLEAEKQAKIQAELKAKAQAEKIQREKVEAELKAKAEAELKAQKEKERIEKERIEKEKKAKNAPEKEKLMLFATLIEKLERPEIKTDEANTIMQNVNTLLSKVVTFIREKSNNL
jgi:hypothetical protein